MTPSTDSARDFEAPELIEVMEEAVNYNRFLVEQLASWATRLGPVLDFGAGNGRFANALGERGVEVHAIEPDAQLRQVVRSRGVAAYESLDSVGDRRFDGIYSINVLEHVEDDQGLLGDFRDRLVERGRLFIYVPAFELLFSANDERVGHVRRYRLQPLVEKIRKAGFVVDRARYVDSIGFLAGLGYRFFGNADGGLDVGAVRLYDRAVFPLSRVLDRAFGSLLGKNLLVHATRQGVG